MREPRTERETVDLGRGPALGPLVADSLPAAFRRQVARAPDAVALVLGDRQMTYRELDRRSDRLAAGLLTVGVRPGDRICLQLPRSIDLIAVMIGVLKAGAAYVPLDPDAPAARTALILAECRPALIVAHSERPDGASPPAVTVPDLLAGGVGPRPDTDTGAGAGAGHAAYVIYTSGSTGTPKGVAVPHRNVLSLLAATEANFGLGPDDVWTWFHSIAFDFSVWEIWGCLLTGGRLIVVPESARLSPEDFCALLAAQRVTILNQTPSSFAQVMDAALRKPGRLPLRLVIFGGEPLDAVSLLRWFEAYPAPTCRLVNMYGITETTVHVTAQDITPELAARGTRSVGRALPGWSVRVVDADGRVLPPGSAGEIAVGGAGVADGYLNRDDLTAERFRVDERSGERLYFSGDLGRILADGRLEHLGRIDQQIKLRGHRIELDEIRAALLADPAVTAAAVVLRRPVPGDPAADRLDGYVVLTTASAGAGAGEDGELGAVLRRCGQRIPAYMVPATLTALLALPLTVNGKIDTSQLPKPAPRPTGEPADDLSITEREVRAAWSAVLSVDPGPDEHFFDLGGNSLLAARLVRRLAVPDLKVQDLYANPTPRRLASRIDELRA